MVVRVLDRGFREREGKFIELWFGESFQFLFYFPSSRRKRTWSLHLFFFNLPLFLFLSPRSSSQSFRASLRRGSEAGSPK